LGTETYNTVEKIPYNILQNDDAPLVSVIVVGQNEKRTIEDCITSIFNQSYPNFEFIYVNDNSSDGTYEKAVRLTNYSKSFKNCKRYLTLSIKANSPAVGRNFGVKFAQGTIIAFTDADCMAEKDWLVNLVKYLPKEMGMVGGPNVLKHFKTSKILDAIDNVLGTYLGSGGSPQFLKINNLSEVYALPTNNLAIQKRLFEKFGGFNERLTYNEDSDFSTRMLKDGYKIVYTPEARVNHFMGIESYPDFLRFLHRYGSARGKNTAGSSQFFTKFNVFSIAFILFLFSLFALSLFASIAMTILLALILIIILILFTASIKIAIRNKSPVYAFLALPIFLSIHIVYNIGFVLGYVSSFLSIRRKIFT
jgi:cellulose synthase/poly-beta-1,6-N-acetylglucosamine synthase-like glycosyltransferase